jgi:hypothetical protein
VWRLPISIKFFSNKFDFIFRKKTEQLNEENSIMGTPGSTRHRPSSLGGIKPSTPLGNLLAMNPFGGSNVSVDSPRSDNSMLMIGTPKIRPGTHQIVAGKRPSFFEKSGSGPDRVRDQGSEGAIDDKKSGASVDRRDKEVSKVKNRLSIFANL